MSDKRDVTTFRLQMTSQPSEWIEGPIVSPDRKEVAQNLTEVHYILRDHRAVLLYDKQWMYIPDHSISKVLRGGRRFTLPWPLVTDSTDLPANK